MHCVYAISNEQVYCFALPFPLPSNTPSIYLHFSFPWLFQNNLIEAAAPSKMSLQRGDVNFPKSPFISIPAEVLSQQHEWSHLVLTLGEAQKLQLDTQDQALSSVWQNEFLWGFSKQVQWSTWLPLGKRNSMNFNHNTYQYRNMKNLNQNISD